MSRKAVVTGLGAISPIGASAHQMWANALKGVSGVVRLEDEWVQQHQLPVYIAGRVSSPISESEYVSRVETKRLDPSGQFAVHSARQAWAAAGYRDARGLPYELRGKLGGGLFGGARFHDSGTLDWPAP